MIHENIKKIDTPLQKVLNLRGVEFIWKEENLDGTVLLDGGRKDIGVIAQEVKEVLPELIGGSEERGYKVSYEQLISVLFEAIKEQELILKDKDGELTELEGKFKRNQ